jgi:hypothetical protein
MNTAIQSLSAKFLVVLVLVIVIEKTKSRTRTRNEPSPLHFAAPRNEDERT